MFYIEIYFSQDMKISPVFSEISVFFLWVLQLFRNKYSAKPDREILEQCWLRDVQHFTILYVLLNPSAGLQWALGDTNIRDWTPSLITYVQCNVKIHSTFHSISFTASVLHTRWEARKAFKVLLLLSSQAQFCLMHCGLSCSLISHHCSLQPEVVL